MRPLRRQRRSPSRRSRPGSRPLAAVFERQPRRRALGPQLGQRVGHRACACARAAARGCRPAEERRSPAAASLPPAAPPARSPSRPGAARDERHDLRRGQPFRDGQAAHDGARRCDHLLHDLAHAEAPAGNCVLAGLQRLLPRHRRARPPRRPAGRSITPACGQPVGDRHARRAPRSDDEGRIRRRRPGDRGTSGSPNSAVRPPTPTARMSSSSRTARDQLARRNAVYVALPVKISDWRWCRRSRRSSTARRAILRCLACCGTRSMSQPGDGLSRLSVGGTTWSRIARMREDRLDRAGRAEQVADRRFGRGHRQLVGVRRRTARLTAPSSISSPSGVEVPCALT